MTLQHQVNLMIRAERRCVLPIFLCTCAEVMGHEIQHIREDLHQRWHPADTYILSGYQGSVLLLVVIGRLELLLRTGCPRCAPFPSSAAVTNVARPRNCTAQHTLERTHHRLLIAPFRRYLWIRMDSLLLFGRKYMLCLCCLLTHVQWTAKICEENLPFLAALAALAVLDIGWLLVTRKAASLKKILGVGAY